MLYTQSINKSLNQHYQWQIQIEFTLLLLQASSENQLTENIIFALLQPTLFLLFLEMIQSDPGILEILCVSSFVGINPVCRVGSLGSGKEFG